MCLICSNVCFCRESGAAGGGAGGGGGNNLMIHARNCSNIHCAQFP